jgi:hypothetical protein
MVTKGKMIESACAKREHRAKKLDIKIKNDFIEMLFDRKIPFGRTAILDAIFSLAKPKKELRY